MKALWSAFLTGMFFVVCNPCLAQESLSKATIRFINASSAGGASDIFMRSLIEDLQKALKQPAIIENRPGGGFNIAARACADAGPDDNTFCVLPGEAVIYNPHLFKSLPYDPEKSFGPLMTLFILPQILAVRSDLGVKTVGELANLSKEKPKTLSYASPGLAQAAFVESCINKEKGGDLVKVPFRGGGDVVTGIMTGTTPIAFVGLSNVLGLLESKAVVGLVVDTKQRLPSLPDVPTVGEIELKGDITVPFFGLFAPARTPKALVERVRTEVEKILANPEFQRRSVADKGLLQATGPDNEIKQLLISGRQAAERIVRESGLTAQ